MGIIFGIKWGRNGFHHKNERAKERKRFQSFFAVVRREMSLIFTSCRGLHRVVWVKGKGKKNSGRAICKSVPRSDTIQFLGSFWVFGLSTSDSENNIPSWEVD